MTDPATEDSRQGPRRQRKGREPGGRRDGACDPLWRHLTPKPLPLHDARFPTGLWPAADYAASSTGRGWRTFATFRSRTTPTALRILSVIQEMSNSYQARP